ncbi:MAG: fatty acid desaturase [Caldithrix sp.]|nr:fatty acid desaturase [Caldithrix sp.]
MGVSLSNSSTANSKNLGLREIHKSLAQYSKPSPAKANGQIINTFIPYIIVWALMITSVKLGLAYWLILVLAIPAAALLIRIFIIFHDCCHLSFFSSRRANRILGFISGILTFTPYNKWRRAHIMHHATSGNLDKRGTGDVWTLTLQEYETASTIKRWGYRLFRNPFILFGIMPSLNFFIGQRLPSKNDHKNDRINLIFSNISLVAFIAVLSWLIGFSTYLMIQLPIMLMAATAGVWLFYVQHQFEGVYWARDEEWDPLKAALQGSSYYKLPRMLQWFSGNIGLHHIHHLNSRIPNYNLQWCYNESELMQSVKPITIRQSFNSLKMKIWDEQRSELIGFREMKARLASI